MPGSLPVRPGAQSGPWDVPDPSPAFPTGVHAFSAMALTMLRPAIAHCLIPFAAWQPGSVPGDGSAASRRCRWRSRSGEKKQSNVDDAIHSAPASEGHAPQLRQDSRCPFSRRGDHPESRRVVSSLTANAASLDPRNWRSVRAWGAVQSPGGVRGHVCRKRRRPPGSVQSARVRRRRITPACFQ